MTVRENFYADLQAFEHFRGVCNPANYIELPADWSVVITDIEGSTAAIQQGRYRDVNAIGVASIVAIFNAVKPLKIPFVFGGDGASLCIPNSYIEPVKKALVASTVLAEKEFSLSLRVGIVPCSVIQQSEFQVMIGKCKVTVGYYQACFTGKGLAYAEKLVKEDPQGLYCVTADDVLPSADFTGFECRWKDVPSPHGETVSILVMTVGTTTEQSNSIYLQVFDAIQKIYGDVEQHRPVQKQFLQLTTQAKNLKDEVKIRAGFESRLARWIYARMLPWYVRYGRYLMSNKKTALDTDWGKYKESLVINTDFRKFDDNLRMVITGSAVQREKLEQYLQQQYQQGLIVYGVHVSDRALMTCVIADYNLHHVHFVDGADGGYAIAAKAMKKQLHAHASAAQQS